jgi:hypothetical protein
MAQTCGKCSRINPAEASYCYYDGSALGVGSANGGPINTGSQPFPHPFVFPSGKVCGNFDQLALAFHENWKEAQELLQQGFLETFLGGCGRTDLAMAAREAARNPDQDRGLDQLLGKLPSQVIREPKLAVEPAEVNLGQMSSRADRQVELRLYNQGMRLLYGSVACDSGVWLALGEAPGSPRKVFQLVGELVIPVQVRGQYLQASGKPVEGRLLIESNGGSTSILVRAEVPPQPFLEGVLAGARSPRQVAEKAKANPKGAAALFENGAVADWYKKNGWAYPIQGPVASGVAAVQQFFEALGLTPAPRVEISPPAVALYGQPGDPARFSLQVKTEEKRPVYAHAVSDQSWLKVERAKLSGRSATITCAVPHVPDCEGQIIRASVTVTANGHQRFAVPVTLEVGSHFRFREAGLAPEENASPPAPLTEFQFDESPSNEEPLESMAAEAPSPRRRQRLPRISLNYRQLRHAIPGAVLALALVFVLIWDLLSPPQSTQLKDSTKRRDSHLAMSDPRIAIQFQPENRRFGIQLLNDPDLEDPAKPKRLTYDPAGATNNTCIKIVKKTGNQEQLFEHLFGQAPGRWAYDQSKRKRLDRVEVVKGQKWQSVMDFDDIRVTQTIAILPNEQTLKFDTCLVHYLVENRSGEPQNVGVRVMLNTMIDPNRGVYFQVPGKPELSEASGDFKQDEVPDFIQVSERSDPQDPGTIAQIGLKLSGLRLTEGDPELDRIARAVLCQWNTGEVRWEWEFKPMDGNPEKRNSCVVVYGPVEPLPAGGKQAMAFTYGLGRATSPVSAGLRLSLGRPPIRPGQEFVVTASVENPEPNQRLRIHLPEGFSLVEGQEEMPAVAKRTGQASWRVRAGQAGSYHLVVTSGFFRGDQDFVVRTPSSFR